MKKQILKEENNNKSVFKDDNKKKQILTFAIGFLVGAIVATGIFLIIRSKERPNMPYFNPSTFEKGDFDKSNFSRRQRNNKDTEKIEEKTQDNTGE